MANNFRGPVRYIAPVINALAYPFAVSAAVRRIVLAARVNTTDSTSRRIAQSGCFILYSVKTVPKEASSRDNHGDDAGKSKFSTPEARENIWEHLHETINV
jgi:hypothetical protein